MEKNLNKNGTFSIMKRFAVMNETEQQLFQNQLFQTMEFCKYASMERWSQWTHRLLSMHVNELESFLDSLKLVILLLII